jgi:exodeoxyribonuclease-3
VVLAGDYNVMPADLDVYAPERWVDDALFRPEVRAAFHRLTTQGGRMLFARFIPARRYTLSGKYFRNAYARNAGLRIDHLLLNREAAGRLTAADVDRDVGGWVHSSDHAPAWVDVAESPNRVRRR